MHLLIVVPDQERATGNWVTATRLQQGLAARGHTVTLAATRGEGAGLRAAVAAAAPDLALLLHAWRSGAPWLEAACALPYAVLLTGTDVNVGLHDPEQAPVIAAVLERAAAVLSQNPLTVAALRGERPELAGRLRHLPPGITLGAAPCPLRDRLGAGPNDTVLLSPVGIRPVKGVLELVELCAPLVDAGRPLRLAVCGPLLDAAYGERFLAALAGRPWANWLGTIPPAAIPAAMRAADIIVSNSASEGLPNALVEAAALGRPVVARDNPGNRAVVASSGNGLLYSDAAGFQHAVCRLLDEPGLRAALSRPDPERFAPAHEAAALEEICREILAGAATAAARLC